MSENQGYVKAHRKMMDKGYYKKSEFVHLWLHLMFKANHKPKEFWFNGKNIKINRGQFITGRKKLSEETGINESKIERILNFFEKSEQQIEQQKSNRNRLITLLNYNVHNKTGQQIEQPVNNQRTTSEQPVNTTNNEKNEKNDNNENKYLKIEIENMKIYILKKLKFSVPKTKTDDLKELIKTFGYNELIKMVDRWNTYRLNQSKRRFCFANRWNRFHENISIVESDQSLKERIHYEKGKYLETVKINGGETQRVDDDFSSKEFMENIK
jgi:hypothetical protein